MKKSLYISGMLSIAFVLPLSAVVASTLAVNNFGQPDAFNPTDSANPTGADSGGNPNAIQAPAPVPIGSVSGASTQNGSVSGASTQVGSVSGQTTGLPTLPNPLGNTVSSIPQLIYKIVNALVDVSYIVVAFFLILSGFKFVMAQGSEEKLSEAKNTFKNTIIGAILIVGAQVIVSVVQSIFAALK